MRRNLNNDTNTYLNWKEIMNKLPYWLRKGIITGLIAVIFFISLLLISENGRLRCMPSPPTDYFVDCNIFMWVLENMFLQSIAFCFIVGFIIGSIIGLIYSKIKKKKSK